MENKLPIKKPRLHKNLEIFDRELNNSFTGVCFTWTW